MDFPPRYKDPAETAQWTASWDTLLPATDSVLTVTVAVEPPNDGLTVISAQVISDMETSVLVKGGTLGQTYHLVWTVTSTAGQVRVRRGPVIVEPQ